MKKNFGFKKILNASLIFAISITAAYADSDTTGKTHLTPRDVGTNMAREHVTWHKMRDAHWNKEKKQFGARFCATGFYQQSVNRKGLGEYFGFLDTADTTDTDGEARDFFGVSADDVTLPLFPADVLHDAANAANFNNATLQPLADKIELRPRHEVGGVHLMYYQNLDAWAKGLYFKLSAPLAVARSSMKPDSEGPDRTQNINAGAGAAVHVSDYLEGDVVQTINPNQQFALNKAKITGGHRSDTSVADIRFDLGYDFIAQQCAHLGLSFMFVIPTSEVSDGEHVFEPRSGAGHWAVGGSLDGHYDWKLGKKTKLGFHAGVNYQYVFEKTERRTLGFRFKNGNLATFGHYILGGKAGTGPVFPLANVLTQEVDVTPASKVDGVLALSLACCNWTFDLGYNIFFKEREDVDVKSWADDTYAPANFAFNTANLFDPTSAGSAFNTGATTTFAIQRTDLATEVAETPSQLTHKLFGGIGYMFSKWNTPLLIGLGGGYEWADHNKALEQWEVFGKIGIAV